MSAIFGMVRWDDVSVTPRELERMGNILAHRGPDGRRAVAEGRAGLGHCLTRVNVEDWHEAQPILDGDVMLVADARIDNRESLAGEIGIADEALAEMSDSAVMLAAYRHWGEGFVEQLIGDFVFALWDARAGVLLLGRDPMGQRGLFYHQGDGFIVFASEIKALWAIEGVPRALLDEEIGRHLLLAIDRFSTNTFYRGIHVLGGATVLRLDHAGTARLRNYWQPEADPAHLGRDEAYYVAAYRAVLEAAVACRVRRLIRHPLVLLSGGFDSGSIAALAAPIVGAQGHRVFAASSVLAEGEDLPFVRDARAKVAAFRGVEHIDLNYYVRDGETALDALEAQFAATDLPDANAYVWHALYRMGALSGARLALDGFGGDYTLNVRPNDLLGRILRRGHVLRFLRELRARKRVTGNRWRRVLAQNVIPALVPLGLQRAIVNARRRVPIWRTRPITREFAESLFASGAIDRTRLNISGPKYNRWNERWRAILRDVARDQPVQQILAGRHGLDFSRPFHDVRVVGLALAIPENLQFRDGLERHLARRALADILPHSLLRSGPGNDSFEPDMFRMAEQCGRGGLDATRALDHSGDEPGRLSRYVDLNAIEALLAGNDPDRKADYGRLNQALRGIAMARFIAWFKNDNR